MTKLDKFLLFFLQAPLFLLLFWKADGTAEYGKAVRWFYLFGDISERRFNIVDGRNFKKWKKINKKDFKAYLDVARV